MNLSNLLKSVAVSPCGTFALIGSAGGALDMYNLQSGQHRRRFPTRLSQAEAKKLKLQQLQSDNTPIDSQLQPPKFGKGVGKHKGAITGIAVDSLNRVVISCGDDGKVKVRFHTLDNLPTTNPDTPVLGFCFRSATARIGLVSNDENPGHAVSSGQ